MIKKWRVTFIVLTLVALLLSGIVLHENQHTDMNWGRDTVKQFNNSFEILRSSNEYSFRSIDNTVYLYGITHYYETEAGLYLIGNEQLYAYIDYDSGTMERHDSIELFSVVQQEQFKVNEFIELPPVTNRKNIWDLLWGED